MTDFAVSTATRRQKYHPGRHEADDGHNKEDSPENEETLAYMTAEAERCLQAKERMMEAEINEAFDVAMGRVKFLCDD